MDRDAFVDVRIGDELVLRGTGERLQQAVVPAIVTILALVPIIVVGDVAGRKQQVRYRIEGAQGFERLVEPLPVELARIVAVEAEMDIGDLRDQHVYRLAAG